MELFYAKQFNKTTIAIIGFKDPSPWMIYHSDFILENMKDFDKKDFEKWFIERMLVGSNTILEYLIHKERQKTKLIVKPKEVVKYGK